MGHPGSRSASWASRVNPAFRSVVRLVRGPTRSGVSSCPQPLTASPVAPQQYLMLLQSWLPRLQAQAWAEAARCGLGRDPGAPERELLVFHM